VNRISMDSLARVSAVLLLIGLVWATGIFAEGDDRRGTSRVRTQPETNVGVGTRVGSESKGAAQESSEARGSLEGDEGVLAVFREVEVGWRAGTPKPFEKYFRKGKVRLDLGEGGPRGGLFARSQAYYLIADYLKGTQTLSIDLVKTSDGTQGKTRPYALLERVYRDRNGTSRKEVVFISLALEDSLWAISELRAIPAK
jgi:hypothetical protein